VFSTVSAVYAQAFQQEQAAVKNKNMVSGYLEKKVAPGEVFNAGFSVFSEKKSAIAIDFSHFRHKDNPDILFPLQEKMVLYQIIEDERLWNSYVYLPAAYGRMPDRLLPVKTGHAILLKSGCSNLFVVKCPIPNDISRVVLGKYQGKIIISDWQTTEKREIPIEMEILPFTLSEPQNPSSLIIDPHPFFWNLLKDNPKSQQQVFANIAECHLPICLFPAHNRRNGQGFKTIWQRDNLGIHAQAVDLRYFLDLFAGVERGDIIFDPLIRLSDLSMYKSIISPFICSAQFKPKNPKRKRKVLLDMRSYTDEIIQIISEQSSLPAEDPLKFDFNNNGDNKINVGFANFTDYEDMQNAWWAIYSADNNFKYRLFADYFRALIKEFQTIARDYNLEFVYSVDDEPMEDFWKRGKVFWLHQYIHQMGGKTWTYYTNNKGRNCDKALRFKLFDVSHNSSEQTIPPLNEYYQANGKTCPWVDYKIWDWWMLKEENTFDHDPAFGGVYTTSMSYLRNPVYNRFIAGYFSYSVGAQMNCLSYYFNPVMNPYNIFDAAFHFQLNAVHLPDLTMIYPDLVNQRIINSLSFEGVREGITDNRYIATLSDLIDLAKAGSIAVSAKLIRQAVSFLQAFKNSALIPKNLKKDYADLSDEFGFDRRIIKTLENLLQIKGNKNNSDNVFEIIRHCLIDFIKELQPKVLDLKISEKKELPNKYSVAVTAISNFNLQSGSFIEKITYQWDLGDGYCFSACQPHITHTYSSLKDISIQLTMIVETQKGNCFVSKIKKKINIK
jgi:hypothetical protein